MKNRSSVYYVDVMNSRDHIAPGCFVRLKSDAGAKQFIYDEPMIVSEEAKIILADCGKIKSGDMGMVMEVADHEGVSFTKVLVGTLRGWLPTDKVEVA